MLDDVDLLVCGAGPVGCVVAERAANVLGWKVLVVDRRPHVAGNCHDSRRPNGVLVHDYGPLPGRRGPGHLATVREVRGHQEAPAQAGFAFPLAPPPVARWPYRGRAAPTMELRKRVPRGALG